MLNVARKKSPEGLVKQWRVISLLRVCFFLCVLCAAAPLAAVGSYDISYNGRFVDSTGRPFAGPLDFTIEFFDAKEGGNQKGSTFTYSAVTLIDGVFQIDISLAASDYNAIFGASGETWIQITDTTHHKTHTRQKFFAVPYALKVPVDGTTVGYDASGHLTLLTSTGVGTQMISTINSGSGTISSSLLPALSGDVTGAPGGNTVVQIQGKPVGVPGAGNVGSFLQYNGSGFVLSPVSGSGGGTVTGVSAATPLSASSDSITPTISLAQSGINANGYLASSDWTAFNAKQPAGSYLTSVPWASPGTIGSTTPSTGAFTTITSSAQDGFELKTFGNGAGDGGELRFDAPLTSNYVGLKAPDSIATNKIWILPAADGATGQVLSTDGSATLGWSSMANGTVTNVSGSSPISVTSGSTTPTISMSQAGGSANGYVSSSDWNSFNGKMGSLNGLAAIAQSLAIGTTGTAPAWSSATSTHTLNLPMSSSASVTAGLLANADWTSFNTDFRGRLTVILPELK